MKTLVVQHVCKRIYYQWLSHGGIGTSGPTSHRPPLHVLIIATMNKLRVAVLASNGAVVVPGSLAKSILTSLTKKELLNKVELINHDLKQDQLPTEDGTDISGRG